MIVFFFSVDFFYLELFDLRHQRDLWEEKRSTQGWVGGGSAVPVPDSGKPHVFEEAGQLQFL